MAMAFAAGIVDNKPCWAKYATMAVLLLFSLHNEERQRETENIW